MSEIKDPRRLIDDIDQQLVELLAKRTAEVRKISQIKANEKVYPLRDNSREIEVATHWANAADHLGLSGYFMGRILREIMHYARKVQEGLLERSEERTANGNLRIAIQGGVYSYSDLTVDKLTANWPANSFKRLHLDSYAATIDALENERADYALLPIENTIAGSLNDVYHLLAEREVLIVGEEILPIEHCLVAGTNATLDTITTVRSHPVALQQCRQFLNELTGCSIESSSDTATAAESITVADNIDLAAVCSEECANRLGLNILKRDISDRPNNYTRFVLLALEAQENDHSKPGKTSLLLTVDHRQGSLAKCLDVFAHRQINLSKLESRRRPESPNEYLFYLDIDQYADTPAVREALEEVRSYTRYFKVLGSYSCPREIDDRIPLQPAKQKAATPQRPKTQPANIIAAERSIVHVGNVPVGGNNFTLIAGPCAVENREQILATAAMVKEHGAAILRGGAFKPRTSPYSFQGLGFGGLEMMVEAGRTYELPIVTEVLRIEDAVQIAAQADALQVGARNMQNYPLLKKLGRLDKPVLLKRGLSASIDDLLDAAEYIIAGGNRRVILCERGIRTFETTTRSTLDISAVPVLKSRTSLPVIVDPSHAAGRRDLVIPLALAAVAAGADGLIVEAHNNPEVALCDGEQALTSDDLRHLVSMILPILESQGRSALV